MFKYPKNAASRILRRRKKGLQDIQSGSAAALVDSASIFNETGGRAAIVGDILILLVLNIYCLRYFNPASIKYLLFETF